MRYVRRIFHPFCTFLKRIVNFSSRNRLVTSSLVLFAQILDWLAHYLHEKASGRQVDSFAFCWTTFFLPPE